MCRKRLLFSYFDWIDIQIVKDKLLLIRHDRIIWVRSLQYSCSWHSWFSQTRSWCITDTVSEDVVSSLDGWNPSSLLGSSFTVAPGHYMQVAQVVASYLLGVYKAWAGFWSLSIIFETKFSLPAIAVTIAQMTSSSLIKWWSCINQQKRTQLDEEAVKRCTRRHRHQLLSSSIEWWMEGVHVE